MKKIFLLFSLFVWVTKTNTFSNTTNGDWVYIVRGNEAAIVAYNGAGGEVVIPDNLDGFSVTQLGSGNYGGFVFGVPRAHQAANTSVTDLTIPDSVKRIGHSALYACWGLTNINFGSGVTNIGESAIRNCHGLTSIYLPDSVLSIGLAAFEGCDRLNKLVIGNGTISIGEFAFDHLGGGQLTNVIIGGSSRNLL